MSPEILSHVPIAIVLVGAAVTFGAFVLKSYKGLIEKIQETVEAAIKVHSDVEDVRWTEIERRLGRVEEKVDRLLERHDPGEGGE